MAESLYARAARLFSREAVEQSVEKAPMLRMNLQLFAESGAETAEAVGGVGEVGNVITDPARMLPAPKQQLNFPMPQMADHHLIPKFRGNSKPYADFIAKRGIDVDQYTITIQHGTGSLHLRNLHGKGKWNENWMKWIDENPNATAKDIFQKVGQMMDDYGLSNMFGNKIHPYGK